MTKVIPPVLFAVLVAALGVLWALHPPGMDMRQAAAMPWDIPLAAGLALLIWARLRFRTDGAEIHTFRTPRSLIVDGVFRFTRNPMYLGFLLILLGAALFVNTWCALLAPLAFFLAANLWYIPHEERTLRGIFGTAYDDYAWRVRRWI